MFQGYEKYVDRFLSLHASIADLNAIISDAHSPQWLLE